MNVTKLGSALGAEITGIDLSRGLTSEVKTVLLEAFHEHLVIVLRDQSISPGEFRRFAEYFGPIGKYPFVRDLPGYPGITEVIKEAGDRTNFGGLWHTDTTYQPSPPLASLLHAVELPSIGGDTLFANMYCAYEALSPGLQRMLADLKAVHTAALRGGSGSGARLKLSGMSEKGTNVEQMSMEATHPVVRTHPVTGRKALYVDCAHTSHFAGMSREESAPLLQWLFSHLSKPEFTCRLQWRPGSLAVWDNRCTQHYALNDYHGQRRLMHRITVAGDVPI